MDEPTYQFLISPLLTYARAAGREPLIEGRKIRTGEICCSCRDPLPQPHSPGRKRCASCVGTHRIYMVFFRRSRWHCRFVTEEQKVRLPKWLIFSDASDIYETASRGGGLTSEAARKALDLAIEVGKGGIWLNLNDSAI